MQWPYPPEHPWIRQIFASKTARSGGVVRRAVRDVDREIGRDALELEVRRRGYRMVECGGQYVIFCSADPIRVIC